MKINANRVSSLYGTVINILSVSVHTAEQACVKVESHIEALVLLSSGAKIN